MGTEDNARQITFQVLVESIPNIGEVAGWTIANRIIDALAEVEIISE